MLDKFELIDRMIVNVDTLADAKGTAKCALVLELQQQLNVLKKGLKDDDAAHAKELARLHELAGDKPEVLIEVPENGAAMEV
jgi:hypothetical protein